MYGFYSINYSCGVGGSGRHYVHQFVLRGVKGKKEELRGKMYLLFQRVNRADAAVT